MEYGLTRVPAMYCVHFILPCCLQDAASYLLDVGPDVKNLEDQWQADQEAQKKAEQEERVLKQKQKQAVLAK